MENTYTGRKVAIFADAHSLLEPTYAALEDMRKEVLLKYILWVIILVLDLILEK